jgi:hypothetical protein
LFFGAVQKASEPNHRSGDRKFKETDPILRTRDIQRAIDLYTRQLGFKLAFGDKADPPNYVGFRRDAVIFHSSFSSSTR